MMCNDTENTFSQLEEDEAKGADALEQIMSSFGSSSIRDSFNGDIVQSISERLEVLRRRDSGAP